jgi:hypothetical protein
VWCKDLRSCLGKLSLGRKLLHYIDVRHPIGVVSFIDDIMEYNELDWKYNVIVHTFLSHLLLEILVSTTHDRSATTIRLTLAMDNNTILDRMAFHPLTVGYNFLFYRLLLHSDNACAQKEASRLDWGFE